VTIPIELYLPTGLPIPVPAPDGLDAPYWDGLRREELLVQRCNACGRLQYEPEWICRGCHSFDLDWTPVEGRGCVFSWIRPVHPTMSALRDHGPYVAVVVELASADGIRMLGNLLGDPQQEVRIGDPVEVAFEHHDDASSPYTLAHWRRVSA
jgi:uncharacterized protein